MPALRAMGLALAVAVWLPVGSVVAQTRADSSAAPELARAKQDTVWIMADGHDDTAVAALRDAAEVASSDKGLRVLTVLGGGAVQTVADVLYLKGVDVGIVQQDALEAIRASNAIPQIADRIRVIARLYHEELHILAGADVTDIRALAGRKVNFGPTGSGGALTAAKVFAALGVTVEAVALPQQLAIARVITGELAATVTMTGSKALRLTPITARAGLRLVPVPYTPALQKSYLPAKLSAKDYPGLVDRDAPIDTIAVATVMVVFNWQKGTARYARVARFVDRFFSQLDALRTPGRHEKWRQVNLAAPLGGWTRFAPALSWLKANQARSAGALATEFKTFLSTRETPGPTPDASAVEQEALFRDFVRWRETHRQPRPRL